MRELIDMHEAVMKDEKDKIELQQQMLAWQTALLMNATGNYKKKITPDMLIGSKNDEGEVKGEVNKVDREVKNRKLNELKAKLLPTN